MVKKKNYNLSFLKNLNQQDIWNCENIYHLKTDISRMSISYTTMKYIRKLLNCRGTLLNVEFFKGSSLIRFLTFREY